MSPLRTSVEHMFVEESVKPEWQRTNELAAAFHASRSCVGAAVREQLRLIARVDEADLYLEEGARNTAHWLCMYLGVSTWKAHRLIRAAHALEHLPLISEALISGELSLDKVLSSHGSPRLRTRSDWSCGPKVPPMWSHQTQGRAGGEAEARRGHRRPALPFPGLVLLRGRLTLRATSLAARGRWRHGHPGPGEGRGDHRGDARRGRPLLRSLSVVPTPSWPCAPPVSRRIPIPIGPRSSCMPSWRAFGPTHGVLRPRMGRYCTPRACGVCCATPGSKP